MSIKNFVSINVMCVCVCVCIYMGFPGDSESKECVCNVGDLDQSLGWKDPLEEDLATQSSILAWRIPCTEEPGGLQSMGSQRVRHN